MILEQITVCLDIPERLLKLSKNIHDGNGPVDCVTSSREIIALLDYEAKRKGIELTLKSSSKKVCILGNDSDFKMLILNLLQNAIKATGSEGKIEVSLRTAADLTTIKVKDTGRGISTQNLPHIFEPFYSEGQKGSQSGTVWDLPS